MAEPFDHRPKRCSGYPRPAAKSGLAHPRRHLRTGMSCPVATGVRITMDFLFAPMPRYAPRHVEGDEIDR